MLHNMNLPLDPRCEVTARRRRGSSCSPRHAPPLAGVLVKERLTVRFKQFDSDDEVSRATWAIVDPLRASSYVLSP